MPKTRHTDDSFSRAADGRVLYDEVYFLVHGATEALWYSPPGTSQRECWDNALLWERCSTGLAERSGEGWMAHMRSEGWVARKKRVVLSAPR